MNKFMGALPAAIILAGLAGCGSEATAPVTTDPGADENAPAPVPVTEATPESADEHDHHPDKLVRAGEAADVDNPFHPIRLYLSSQENTGSVTFYEFEVPPQSPGSPPHTHSREDEYFFILEGRLSVLSGEDVLKLDAGDFAALNRGNTHMFWNADEEPVRLLMATTGGSFEEFMANVAPTLAAAAPADPMQAGAVVGQLAQEYGIEISMEKMPAEAAPFYGQ